MTFLALLGHLANFVAPALVVAAVLWAAQRMKKTGGTVRWRPWTQWSLTAGAGVLVLLAGLLVFGRDGKMVTYAALVLVQGSLVWWMRRR